MTQRNRSITRPGAPSDRFSAVEAIGRNQRSADEMRKTIAQTAARLIAEGLSDYQEAKRKAARQLGVISGRALPEEHEIESALREYFVIFGRRSQPRTLSILRATAIRAMLRLAQFSPWLAGTVLTGTATDFSEIELELIAVEPKEFEMYLLNAGIKFDCCDTPSHKSDPCRRNPPTTRYRLEIDGTVITIALYEHHSARLKAHPRTSIRHDRAQRADAEIRFAGESAESKQ